MEELLQAKIDNSAVDRFAQAMKDKLTRAREKGRGGWDDKIECTDEHLAKLFFEHLEKTNDGNLIDLANFLMFLSERGADGSVLVDNKPIQKTNQNLENNIHLKNAPKTIFLQVREAPVDADFSELREVSWCKEQINDNDIKYVLVDNHCDDYTSYLYLEYQDLSRLTLSQHEENRKQRETIKALEAQVKELSQDELVRMNRKLVEENARLKTESIICNVCEWWKFGRCIQIRCVKD